MKNIKLDYSIYALTVISFLIYFIYLYFFPVTEKTFFNYLKIVPTVVTVDSIIVLLFTQFLWKFRIFRNWLVLVPNLNGTWEGTIETTWIDDKTGERPASIPTVLIINQSLFNISCIMRTDEMTSESKIAGFVTETDSPLKKLTYTYFSSPKPTVIDRSRPHFGTMLFELVELSKTKFQWIETPKFILKGGYWTDRKTTGHIELRFKIRKQINEIPRKLKNHPVSQIRNNKS